jgi:cytochrome c
MRTGIRAAALTGLATAILTGAGCPQALAQEPGEQLAQAARCGACHLMSEPLLGPPWVAIAARHAARKEVMVDVLAHKIVHGGGGNWGIVPMVPNQWVSIDEARVIAQWILNLDTTP